MAEASAHLVSPDLEQAQVCVCGRIMEVLPETADVAPGIAAHVARHRCEQ